MAGGLNPRAGNTVTISRTGQAPQVIQVNSAGKDGDQNNPEILPGDRISVGQAGIVYVLGEVGHPGVSSSIGIIQSRLCKPLRWPKEFKTRLRSKRQPFARHRGCSPIDPGKHSENPETGKSRYPRTGGDVLYIYGSLTRGLGRSVIQTVLATASSAAIYVEAGR